jgi:hypothetical protein
MPRSQSCSDSQRQPKRVSLHEVNKLRQLDPGHRHFDWNWRAATFTMAENGYRVLAAARKQEDVESLLPANDRRSYISSVYGRGRPLGNNLAIRFKVLSY